MTEDGATDAVGMGTPWHVLGCSQVNGRAFTETSRLTATGFRVAKDVETLCIDARYCLWDKISKTQGITDLHVFQTDWRCSPNIEMAPKYVTARDIVPKR